MARGGSDLVGLVLLPIQIAWWVVHTIALGVGALTKAARFGTRLPTMLSKKTACPRGHAVPLYGVFLCASCRAVHEGYVFGRCRVCGGRAGWTSCPTCQLPVRSPFV